MELESPLTGKWNKQEGVLLRYQGRSYEGKDWDEAYLKMQKALRKEKRNAMIAMIAILAFSLAMVLV